MTRIFHAVAQPCPLQCKHSYTSTRFLHTTFATMHGHCMRPKLHHSPVLSDCLDVLMEKVQAQGPSFGALRLHLIHPSDRAR